MKYLVESQFRSAPTPEVLALFPAETARGAELDAEGVRLQLFFAADRSRAWQIFRADSQHALQQILATLPLHPYLHSVITPLADS